MRPTLDELRGLNSESHDPRQWPHLATRLTWHRAIAALAELFGVAANEEAVLARRLETDPDDYAATLLQAAGMDWLLVDDGYPPPGEGVEWRELGALADCQRPARAAHRAGRRGGPHESARPRPRAGRGGAGARLRGAQDDRGIPRRARPRGAAAAHAREDRLEGPLLRGVLLAALEANEATGDPLPVQVHAGFGDADLFLPTANPALLKPLVERFGRTPFVLLHNYPYVREAGWLAHVYANVWLDVSLTVPLVSRPAEMLRQALELAPISKLLYGSDAARTPELYYLAALWWREALAEVLAELPPAEAEAAGRAVLRENALALYRLG